MSTLYEALTGHIAGTTQHCMANGCAATSKQPGPDGWSYLGWDGEFGIENGFYCPPHAEAIESFTDSIS